VIYQRANADQHGDPTSVPIHSAPFRQGLSYIFLAKNRRLRVPRTAWRESDDSRHRDQRAWPAAEWRNPLSHLQNRVAPFQLCPLICQIRAFRAFWPASQSLRCFYCRRRADILCRARRSRLGS